MLPLSLFDLLKPAGPAGSPGGDGSWRPLGAGTLGHPTFCTCAGCCGLPVQQDQESLGAPASAGLAAGPTAHKDVQQAALQITRDNLHWGATIGQPFGPITFGFRTSAPSYSVAGDDVRGTFTPFSASEQAAARAALKAWADVAGITFLDMGNTNQATIEFSNYRSSTDNSEAFAFFPSTPGNTAASSSDGDVFVNTFYASTTNDSPGTYEYEALTHEIGHTLGLEHPGNYNAGPGQTITYANSATYVEDSRQYTLMSYFDETNTGARFSTNVESPMLDDIAAIQRLYGPNLNTRIGNTVYGFNSNAGGVYAISSPTQHVAYSIWDAGGNDTLDFSGYAQDALIDLSPEHFSSVGGDIDNVSIASGVAIENAVGGSGNDAVVGNALANILNGGSGNDTLTGGLGADTFIFASGDNADTITDFSFADGDVINLTGFTNIRSFAQILADAAQVGSATVLTFDPLDTLTLSNVAESTLSLSDFMLSLSVPATDDFNGDRKSDILWRNDNGEVGVWNSNAGSVTFTPQDLGSVAASWQIQQAADFNGDGKADILWRNTNGDTLLWNSNTGSETYTGLDEGIIDGQWSIQKAADFNGDGKADILWRNSNGDTFLWNSNPGSVTFAGQDFGVIDAAWSIQQAADFNGDGKADILWRNTNGDAFLWNSAASPGSFTGQDLGVIDAAWSIQQAADFNGDDKADILWRNTNGDTFLWNSAASSGSFTGQDLGVIDPAWSIQKAADFNGDGKADILWRNSDGDAFMWNSNPGSVTFTGQDFGIVTSDWKIAP